VRQECDRNGKCLPLTMDPEYVSRGIRTISEKLIEQELVVCNIENGSSLWYT
jgi:hypothetical protein